jgi:hypothetical protein
MRGLSAILSPALLVALTLASSCRGDRDFEQVSDNSTLQISFEVAKQILADIKLRKYRGQEIYGDCKMVRALFLRTLQKMQSPAAQRVARELISVCASARRDARRY